MRLNVIIGQGGIDINYKETVKEMGELIKKSGFDKCALTKQKGNIFTDRATILPKKRIEESCYEAHETEDMQPMITTQQSWARQGKNMFHFFNSAHQIASQVYNNLSNMIFKR